MGANRADVWRLVGFIEGDLRQVQGKFTELRSMLASGALDRAPADEQRCSSCGAVFSGERALLDHRYNVHGEGELCLDCGQVKETGHSCRF